MTPSISATSLARKAEHVAQDEHGALTRRESLQPGNEREPDRFSRFVSSLGLLDAVGDAFEQDVWIGLEPDGLAEASRRRRHGGSLRRRLECARPPAAIAQRVQQRFVAIR